MLGQSKARSGAVLRAFRPPFVAELPCWSDEPADYLAGWRAPLPPDGPVVLALPPGLARLLLHPRALPPVYAGVKRARATVPPDRKLAGLT